MLHGKELLALEMKNILEGLSEAEVARSRLLYRQRRIAKRVIQVIGVAICLLSIGPCWESAASWNMAAEKDLFWLVVFSTGWFPVVIGTWLPMEWGLRARAQLQIEKLKKIEGHYRREGEPPKSPLSRFLG